MCTCIEDWNKNLEDNGENTFIESTNWTMINESDINYKKVKTTIEVVTSKIKPGRTKKTRLVPTYCCFCGKKYEYV